MAGKRLVMGASPGTGLFVHEPRAKNRYSREVPKEDGGKSVADQEEEKINARLVEILERKVAKLRTKAEQEEQGRKVAEAELEELRPQFEQLQQEAAALRHAHRELSEDRQEAQRRNAELAGVQQRCRAAQQALQDRDAELQRLQDQSARAEEQWKAQIVKLVEEMRKVEQRTATLAKELAASKAELAKLKAGGQDVVQRYEEESGRRLELEEKCLHLEEKLKSREQRSRDETAQKAKQSQASQANVAKLEERAKQQEEQNLEMARRMEEAEARCRAAEAELERLRAACAAKGRRVEELEAERCEEPPGRPPIPRSRPGTGSSVGSRHPGHDSRTQPLQSASESRLPPGAIRRGGSVPARRPQGLGSLSRSISPKAPQRSTFGAGIARVATSRPSSRGSRPGSAHQSEELEIDDAIPSDSEDSSDEEILTSVKTAA